MALSGQIISSQEDNRDIIDAGYKPQLHRKIGFFSSFAISFSLTNVTLKSGVDASAKPSTVTEVRTK